MTTKTSSRNYVDNIINSKRMNEITLSNSLYINPKISVEWFPPMKWVSEGFGFGFNSVFNITGKPTIL